MASWDLQYRMSAEMAGGVIPVWLGGESRQAPRASLSLHYHPRASRIARDLGMENIKDGTGQTTQMPERLRSLAASLGQLRLAALSL